MCIAGERARFPWCAMVVNKLLASFIYFFLFLNAEYSPDSDKGLKAHPFAIPVWVYTCVEIKRRRADAGMEATSRRWR